MHTSTEYLVRMHVVLEPVGRPWITIDVDGQSNTQNLLQQQKFAFEFSATNVCALKITHFQKTDHDPTTAVMIKEIGFFDIVDPRFVWAGVYTPNYPEPWYSQQISTPPQTLYQQNYLGWNGTWRLDFSVPVFAWMHKTLNLGWAYQ